MNSGAGCEYTHVDVGGVEVFACVTAASASCSFSFTGTGYGIKYLVRMASKERHLYVTVSP